MHKTSQVALGAMALALGFAAQPASALSTAGWSQADRSAATIREFQTKLMVAALRCRAAGIDVLASYNQFVSADRAELAAANERLKVHFKSASPVNGDRDYDRYTTSLANNFAGTQWSPDSCDGAARQAREAAEARGNLLAVASESSELASSAPRQWSAPARNDRPVQQAYDDRGPPPGYYDNSPSWRDRDNGRAQQAYNDRSPPPGYYDQSSSGYDDRGPPPGYDDRGSRDYGGY